MARPATRTAQLHQDVIAELKGLFGTIKNAYDKLGFTNATLPFPDFYRALNGLAVKPAMHSLILAHWSAWRDGVHAGAVNSATGWRLNPN